MNIELVCPKCLWRWLSHEAPADRCCDRDGTKLRALHNWIIELGAEWEAGR